MVHHRVHILDDTLKSFEIPRRVFPNIPQNMAGIFVRKLATIEQSASATLSLFCFGQSVFKVALT
jgi:hypothetical protein